MRLQHLGVRLRFHRMFPRFALVSAIALFIAHAASGQTVTRAYADNDGKAHVMFANGVDRTINPQPKQVACADVSVADDGRTVGWSVLVENCCTNNRKSNCTNDLGHRPTRSYARAACVRLP